MQDNNHVVQLCPNKTNPSDFAVSEHKISTQECEHSSTSVLSLDRDTKEACRQSFSELLGQGETGQPFPSLFSCPDNSEKTQEYSPVLECDTYTSETGTSR